MTFFRVAVFVLPTLVYFFTRRICEELRDSEWHPLRGSGDELVARADDGGFAARRPGSGA